MRSFLSLAIMSPNILVARDEARLIILIRKVSTRQEGLNAFPRMWMFILEKVISYSASSRTTYLQKYLCGLPWWRSG